MDACNNMDGHLGGAILAPGCPSMLSFSQSIVFMPLHAIYMRFMRCSCRAGRPPDSCHRQRLGCQCVRGPRDVIAPAPAIAFIVALCRPQRAARRVPMTSATPAMSMIPPAIGPIGIVSFSVAVTSSGPMPTVSRFFV